MKTPAQDQLHTRVPRASWFLALLTLLMLTSSVHAQSLTTLQSFTGEDGKYPRGQLAEGADGNYYGTTTQGGTYDLGTVFRLTPGGTLTVLHSFGGQERGDGGGPVGLTLGPDGNFYGATGLGGKYGAGTIYRLTPAGVVTLIYQLRGRNGTSPGTLTLGPGGLLYGTTVLGGTSNQGTVFKVSTQGRFISLHSFGYGEGTFPQGVAVGPDGYLYGVTSGGVTVCTAGTVYKISTQGKFQQLVCDTNLQTPLGLLALHPDGNFYGTSSRGGIRATGSCDYTVGCGTIFKVTPTGTITTAYAFTGGSDGSTPTEGLTLGSDGYFYGSTSIGANNGGEKNYNGTLFRFAASGQLSTIHVFNGTDGRSPSSPLLDTGDGGLLGTTFYGGTQDEGTVFKLEDAVGTTP